MSDCPEILALSYALPPSLFPQSIQIGRLLHYCPMSVGAVSGQHGDSENGMDCYPDFSERLVFHLQVPHRVPLPPKLHAIARKFISLYGRAPDELRSWVNAAEKAVLQRCPNLARQKSVIVSFGEPMSDHLLGMRLKKRTGLPWLAHFSDPWSDNPFRKPFFVANLINRKLERCVIGQADQVLFTSEETRSLVMAKYPSAWTTKTAVLPHSFDPSSYSKAASSGESIVVRYMGTFYANRTPQPVLEALARIHRDSPDLLHGVRFEFIGGIASRILRRARRIALPEGLVEFFPSVGYRESLRLMTESDLLLVIDAPADISVFLPSKLIDYVGAGIPVLGVVPPGSSASLISRLGGGTADPGNPKQVAEVLSVALRECKSRKSRARIPWGTPAVRDQYSVERVASEFAKNLKNVMRGNS